MGGYRELQVWQRAMDLSVGVYRFSRSLPREEQFGLTSQLLRAAASVPANLAEGHQRGSRKDYARFVSIARGSLAETETFLTLATRAGLVPHEATAPLLTQADELSRMLYALRRSLTSNL